MTESNRWIRRVVAGIALVLLTSMLHVATATATTVTTFNVTTTADATGSCTASKCTLRAAVAAANALSNGGGTINVPAGVYNLTLGSLTISKPTTTIVGAKQQPGPAATTIDGGAKDRVFRTAASNVTLDGLVIRNGKAKTTDSIWGDDGIAGDGGAILV